MSSWSKDELCMIATSDDLHVSPFREDGLTYGTPTWNWSRESPVTRWGSASHDHAGQLATLASSRKAKA
jgi:hypothetical protein